MNNKQELDEGLLLQIAEYVKTYQAEKGRSPSQAEIAYRCGINTKRAFKYVQALVARKIIELTDSGRIKIPLDLDPEDYLPVPKLGTVKCGQPSFAVEDYDGVFRLPRAFVGSGEFFMLEAKGDSMVDANIFEGDFLVIRKQPDANFGDIVVACRESEHSSDEDATLKRLVQVRGKPVLRAENEDSDEYPDMDAREFRIIGKLKCVIRDMEVVE